MLEETTKSRKRHGMTFLLDLFSEARFRVEDYEFGRYRKPVNSESASIIFVLWPKAATRLIWVNPYLEPRELDSSIDDKHSRVEEI